MAARTKKAASVRPTDTESATTGSASTTAPAQKVAKKAATATRAPRKVPGGSAPVAGPASDTAAGPAASPSVQQAPASTPADTVSEVDVDETTDVEMPVSAPHVTGSLTPVSAESLPVRPGEDPWTEAELEEVRSDLVAEIQRLEDQLEISAAELVGLLRDGSDGAGRDPADVGSTNFERDHEMSLANNARIMLDQSALALRHIALGTYGRCDNCAQPIGKGRLQAFPRATLCVSCKQREERR